MRRRGETIDKLDHNYLQEKAEEGFIERIEGHVIKPKS